MDGIPPQLQYLLQDPLVIKVGVGIREDVRRLAKDYGIITRSAVDIADVVRALQPALLLQHGTSLAGLCRTLLGITVDKALQCSDWGAAKLSKRQLRYAALDACLSLRIAEQLQNFLLSQHAKQPAASSNGSSNLTNWSGTASVSVAAGMPCETSALLAPYIIKDVSDKGATLLCRAAATSAAPRLPHRFKQQQQAVPLLPWLLPAAQSSTNLQAERLQVCGAPEQLQQQGQQQHEQQCKSPAQHHCNLQQAKQVLHSTLHQLHFRRYIKAFPQLQQQLQQQQKLCSNKQPDLQQQQLQQERRQRQLEQLQRLGQVAAVPNRNIFDKMHNLKPARLPTRKSVQYENCRILGPDGKALATCGIKKVRWYLDRCLAELVEEAPSIALRLRFTPRGSGHADDLYYLSDKDNRCVVCGHEGDYLRHSIVPHCYRQHFPAGMKSHLSHDIVLLCVGCHQICNILDQKKMAALGHKYGAPLEDESRRFQVDRQLAQVRSAGKALSSAAAAGKIPPPRVLQLQQVIMRHFGTAEWRPGLVAKAIAVEPKRQDETWESHAAVVVGAVMAAGRQQQQQQRTLHDGEQNDASKQQRKQQQQQCSGSEAALMLGEERRTRTQVLTQQQQQQQQQGLVATTEQEPQQWGGAEQQQQRCERLCPSQQQQQQRRSAGGEHHTGSKPLDSLQQQQQGAAVTSPLGWVGAPWNQQQHEQPQQYSQATRAIDKLQPLQRPHAAHAHEWDMHKHAAGFAALLEQQAIGLAGAGVVAALVVCELYGASNGRSATSSSSRRSSSDVEQCRQTFTLICSSSSSSPVSHAPMDNFSKLSASNIATNALHITCSNFGEAASVFAYGFHTAWLAASAAAAAAAAMVLPGPRSSYGSLEQGQKQQRQQPIGMGNSKASAVGNGNSSTSATFTQQQQGSRVAVLSGKAEGGCREIKALGVNRFGTGSSSSSSSAAVTAAVEEAALGDFIRDWRRHFLSGMQPKFLPPFWSVDARVKNSGTDMPPAPQHKSIGSL